MNIAFNEFWHRELCVITYVFGTVLLQQHHLPRPDDIACLEAVVKATEHLLPSLEAQVCKC